MNMKKNLIIIMALCVLTIGAQAQTWVNLGSVEPKEISATVTESNSQSIRVHFDTKGFNSESVNEGNTIYQRLSIPGAGKTQTVGSPELPLFRQMVAIPECSNVSLSFQVLQEQVLNNYNVYPAPDHQVITNPDSTCYVAEVFSKNALCYVDNLVSPSNNVELSETGHFRSQKYAEIQVSPIRYNPATQKLYVAKEIEVTLTLTNATGATSANLGIFNNVAAHTMLNYESTGMTAEVNDMRSGGGSVNYIELQTVAQANSIQADYLIICAEQFIVDGEPSDELMRIARHRANYNGYDVVILNIDNILQVGFSYSNPSYKSEGKMRSCIEMIYNGSNAHHTFDGHLGYVLFVGKPPIKISENYENTNYHGFVPTSYSHGVLQQFMGYSDSKYPSDYWFSCITHNNQNEYDNIGDLFIGRLCVENDVQLSNFVNKIIKREKEYRPIQNKIVNAANDTIRSNFNGYFSDTYYPYLRNLIGQNRTLTTADRWIDDIGTFRTKVVNMLNSGSPLFIIDTHGSVNGWQTLIETGSGYNLLDYLDNGNTMNQFCLSYACLTGEMDCSINCLAQNITTNEEQSGMVGFLGSGRLIPGYDNHPSTFIIGLLPKAIYNDLSHVSGEFILEAFLLDNDDEMRYKLNLFGDPALNVMARGFEITNEITLDDFTEINDVITIKNGGRVIIPDNALVVVGDNAGFKVMSTGSLSIGKNVSIKSINGNNSFIQIAGGEFITSTQGNISFEKMNVKFSNPSFVANKTYNLHNLSFSMTEVYTTAVNMYVTNCNFEKSSNVCADHTCFSVVNSDFDRSGLVVGNTSVIGIPVGGVLPTTSAFVNNCSFIDCIPFEYPTYGLARATSNSAIRLQNVSNYELQNNTFIHCVEGVLIKNSGNNQYSQVYKNSITGCTSHGVIVYNSYANLHKNTISGNGGVGVSIYNNSLVTLNDSPGNPNDYQLISQNNPYQIYASNNAFPKCNYNKFIGNNNGDYWMYYDSNGTSASIPTSQFNVKLNNWNGNMGFNPIAIFNVPSCFEWLPFWTMAKSGEDLTDSEMLYEQAVQDFEDSLYVKAKSGFLHIISDYPEDWVAISALKELLRVENCLDKDYSNLKSYYLTNETIQQHGTLQQLAGFLSARCDVNMKKYEDALEWYATQLSDENLTYQDSIFYIIDVGDIYYLMEDDSICKANLPVWFEEHKEVLPKSIIEHEESTKRLLSTLPVDNGMESNPPTFGEFYSYTGWEDQFGGSGIRCLAHYTEHGKKVELPYSYLIDDPEAMHIVELINDATPGTLYNKDDGAGYTNKLYRSMDYGHTWEAIDDLSSYSDEYWTFMNAPGVLLKRNTNPEELKISYDYGNHFETLNIPCFYLNNEAGWNMGEFFKEDYSDELSSWFLTHSMDFNQTVDTVYYSEQEFLNMRAGAKEGELYTYYPSYDDPNYYIMSYKLFFSPDYGQHQQMVMTVDSLIIGDVNVMDSWEFIVDSEPGVFYSIKRENSIVYANSGKIWIDYYRDYGDTLVTTYFHHFRPDWFNHHTPVMDCEIVTCDNSGVTLHWNEPELKPEEVLIGYQIYRGVTLVSEDLVTETEYTDNYSGGGRLNYHILAVYSDGETSKSYNIVYSEQTEGIGENEDAGITLSPNPTSGLVRIEGTTVSEVRVYNTIGQLLKTARNTNEVNLRGLPQGVYLLRIMDESGNIATRKVVME